MVTVSFLFLDIGYVFNMAAQQKVTPSHLGDKGRVKAFLVGASLSVITILYLGRAYKDNPGYEREGGAPLLYVVLAVWLSYGIANVMIADASPRLGDSSLPDVRRKFMVGGMAVGLAFSLFGNFVAQYPTKLFRLPQEYKYYTIPLGMLLYLGIFGFIVFEANRLFDLA
jgi:hypothetical protein